MQTTDQKFDEIKDLELKNLSVNTAGFVWGMVSFVAGIFIGEYLQNRKKKHKGKKK